MEREIKGRLRRRTRAVDVVADVAASIVINVRRPGGSTAARVTSEEPIVQRTRRRRPS